jgi:hypothetical protein
MPKHRCKAYGYQFRKNTVHDYQKYPLQPCSETSSVFIIRPTTQWYGVLVNTDTGGEFPRMFATQDGPSVTIEQLDD